jgi:hypothetical protein
MRFVKRGVDLLLVMEGILRVDELVDVEAGGKDG